MEVILADQIIMGLIFHAGDAKQVFTKFYFLIGQNKVNLEKM